MALQIENISDPRIERAVTYIHEHFRRTGLSVHEIAASAGLSPYHFSRLFRSVTRRSPHGYVTEVRLEEARRLLARGCRSIESIARDCGYASHAHFTNSFGRNVGCTPAAYRVQQRAKGLAVAGASVPAFHRQDAELSTA